MNEFLKAALSTYEKEKEKIRKRIDANKQTISTLNNQIDSFFNDCVSFTDRINAHKENKQIITDLESKLAAAYENENILNTAIKLANEMKVDVVANALKNEIISNPEKWTKYPIHFKKFQEIIKEFLSGTGLSFYSTYGSGYYLSGLYHECGDTHAYILTADNGSITNKIIDEMKNKQEYSIIKASDILAECKKAFATRKKIIAKYENVKDEINALRGPFKSNTIYNILPYAKIDLENYKRF